MQVLQAKLRLVTDWIIGQKSIIYKLIIKHLPIYRAIKQFVQTYINHMSQIVTIIENMQQKQYKNTLTAQQNTMKQLLNLMRDKQLVNMGEWLQKLDIIQSRYDKKASTNAKPFPDIFKDIDADIAYYDQLRSKLRQAIHKSNILQYKYISSPSYKLDSYNLGRDTPRRKTDIYAELYDNKYLQKQKLKNQNKDKQKMGRHAGKIRTNCNYNSVKSEQLSPYKLVNPKYSPNKEENSFNSIKNRSISPNKYQQKGRENERRIQTQTSEKYNKYRMQLYEDMKNYIYESQKSLQAYKNDLKYDSPIRKINVLKQFEHSTANSQKQKLSPHRKINNLQENNKNKVVQQPKQKNRIKYQYWFQGDQQISIKEEKNNQRSQVQKQYQTNKKISQIRLQQQNIQPFRHYRDYEKNYFNLQVNNDSLQNQDKLGEELEMDYHSTQAKLKSYQEQNLQRLLADSLMSSKKWDSNVDINIQIQNEGDKDSLQQDDDSNIRRTGKFQQIIPTDSDEDQINHYEQIQKASNYLQKKSQPQNRGLNLSFGKHQQ